MSTPVRVLILEDSAADAELMLHELRLAGFDPNWQRVEAEPDYLAVLETNPDLILADWSLPQFSGLRALQLMNERGWDIPFIIVSGSIGEEAAIEAMRQGASDYVLKDRPARLGQAVQHALENKQMHEQRRRAEEALRASEQKFRSFVEQSEDAVVLTDEKGAIIEWNRGAERLFGQQQANVAGQFLWEVQFQAVPPEQKTPQTYEHLKTTLLEALKTGEGSWLNQLQETATQRSDGICLTIQTMAFPIQTKNGFRLGSISRDITERKRTEEALKLRMEQLVAINQASQAVATCLDLDQVLKEVMSLASNVVGSEYTSVVLVDKAGHISRGMENMPGVLPIERRARKRGFTSWILRTRRPAMVDEIGEAGVIRPRFGEGAPRTANPHLVANGIKSFVGLPLIVEERTVGVLYLHSLRPGTFHDQLILLTTFASQVAIAIEKARLYDAVQKELAERKQAEEALARQAEELRQRNEELARLYRASGSLLSGASLSIQELAQTIVGVVQQEFGQANCSLLVIQRDSNELQCLTAVGPYADQVKDKTLTLDGPGLVPQAIRTGLTLNVGNVRSTPDYLSSWEAAQSELTVPLKIGSKVIGVIDVQSAQPDAFSPDDERLMTIFAERAAMALEHSRMYGQIEARLQQLAALRTVDMAISSSFDINLTLGVLLDQLSTQLCIHAADVLVYNPITQTFRFSCGLGFRTQALQHTHLRLGEGFAGKAALERRLLKIPDLCTEPSGFKKSPLLLGEDFVAYIGVPLVAKGQIKGVLEVFQREPLDLNSEDQAFLEILGGQAAIAIDNAELFDNLQSSNSELSMAYDSTLEGWASALELRDHETEGHTRRATELTTRLAQAMGIKENDMVHIYRGALLHDIGKMGVPDSIVLKPGPLTEDEWVTMRKHPQYAYDMLSPISYLRLALDIPYCHHEKWDGTGYPRGLKGEQIPMAARIFAVVDVWDALTSDRPYRKAWTETQARQYIQEQAGQHFDPEVVKVFLKEVGKLRGWQTL